MEDIIIKYDKIQPVIKKPILIEGLPGIGNVGLLSVNYLIKKLNATRFIQIFSKYFPPQVTVNVEGVIRQMSNELYYIHREPEDLVLLVGDAQGISGEGQYMLADCVFNLLEKYNTKIIYTLGGYGVGTFVEKCRIFGAATSIEFVESIKKYGVTFLRGEPSSGIIGAAGLLLGLGKLRGVEGVCLMGETPGFYDDWAATKGVLTVLDKILNLNLDFMELDENIDKMFALITKLTDAEKKLLKKQLQQRKHDLGYIW